MRDEADATGVEFDDVAVELHVEISIISELS
jgi:hypothetical protein